MRKLNKKEQQVYEAINEFIVKFGYSPSYRELCELTKIKSTASVLNYIHTLAKKGYITYMPNLNRTIRIIESIQNGE